MTFSLNIKTKEQLDQEKQQEILLSITKKRNEVMTSGIKVNGLTIATDNISQQRITGAALSAVVDPNVVINWKTNEGVFIPLDAQTIIYIATLVRNHIQVCFDREAELRAAVINGETVDIDSGWPE